MEATLRGKDARFLQNNSGQDEDTYENEKEERRMRE